MKLIDLLKQAKEIIAETGRFEMSQWHSGILGEEVNIKECGTACCIGGWMVALLEDEMNGGDHNEYCMNLQSYYDLDELFYAFRWDEFLDPKDWDRLYAEVVSHSILDDSHKEANKRAWFNSAFDKMPAKRKVYWAGVVIDAYIDNWEGYLDKEVTIEDLNEA